MILKVIKSLIIDKSNKSYMYKNKLISYFEECFNKRIWLNVKHLFGLNLEKLRQMLPRLKKTTLGITQCFR